MRKLFTCTEKLFTHSATLFTRTLRRTAVLAGIPGI